MSLKQQITNDIKTAMKNKDVAKRDVLRVIKAEISREEGGLKDLDDTAVIKLITKVVKNLEEVNDEKSVVEKNILSNYLPKQLSESEVTSIIEKIIAEVGASSMKEMGQVMGKFSNQYAGQADGSLVSKIVKQKLR